MAKGKFFNRVVLVTGASMGIGREIALAFAREGAKLVLAARSQEKLEALSKEIAALGAESVFIVTDVTLSQDLDYLLQNVEKCYGRLDILVNNAGKGLYSLIENNSLSDFIDVMNLNLFAVVDLTRKALPLLKKNPDSMVINISSMVGHLSVPKMAAYSASKHALNAFTEALRVEWTPYKIHVLGVYPAITDTGFSEHAKRVDARPTSYATQGRGTPASKVAQKILRAAHKKKRDEFIHLRNRFIALFHSLFPKIIDLALRRFVS